MRDYTDGQLEALKWIALASMFVDHFGRHLLGWEQHSIVFAAGRIAFPLFALVLGLNLARPGDRAGRALRTSVRLAVACAVSVLPSIWARGDPAVVNIFGTLALGTALCWLLATPGHVGWRVALCLAIAYASGHVEYDLLGVFLIPAIYLWRVEEDRAFAMLALVLFLAVANLNRSFGGAYGLVGTLLALPLAMVLGRVRVEVPRMRWLFYAIYPVHLALIGALKRGLFG